MKTTIFGNVIEDYPDFVPIVGKNWDNIQGCFYWNSSSPFRWIISDKIAAGFVLMFHFWPYSRKTILFRTRTDRNGRPLTALGTTHRGRGGGRLAPAVGYGGPPNSPAAGRNGTPAHTPARWTDHTGGRRTGAAVNYKKIWKCVILFQVLNPFWAPFGFRI